MSQDPSDFVTHPGFSLESLVLRKLQPPRFLKGDLEMLTEKYDPPRILHRDKEMEHIAEMVLSSTTQSQPNHLFIYGKSGSGKTAAVNHVIHTVQRLARASRPTVALQANCRNQVSHHALLSQLVEQIEPGRFVPSNTAWRNLYNRLLQAAQKAEANIVIVLDEVNRLTKKKEGFDAIYTLSNLNSELTGSRSMVTLFAISNDLHYGDQLEQSVRSRLKVEKLYFAPYSQPQLADILTDRAKLVFTEEGLEAGIVAYCAARAAQTHGDARHALALLHKAAVIASRDGALQVTMHHVLEARSALEHDIIAEGIQRLTAHEKMLLLAIARLSQHQTSNTLITTGRVLEGYRAVCQQMGSEPLTLQSVNRLLTDIASQGFIASDVRSLGRGRGRTTIVNLTVPVESTIKILQDDHLFHLGG